MPVTQVAEQLQRPSQAGGSGRADPGQPLHHAQALRGPGLTSPQIGERQYISRRTVQTHPVYVSAKLDIAFRAPARRPGHPPPPAGAAPAPVAPAEDSALPGELPRGAYLPGTVRSPQQTAESSGLRSSPVPCADDGIRRMADVSCGPGRHGRDGVAAGRRRSPRSAQADRHGGIMTNPIMPPSPTRLTQDGQCPHQPPCPGALEPDRLAARLVARYPDQGWSLLCNGVVLLDDGDQLLPDGRIAARSPRVPVPP